MPWLHGTWQAAGVKVIMTIGNHPFTAKFIANQVKIVQSLTAENVARERGISCEELERSGIKAIVVYVSQIKDLEQDD
ncbi:Sodium/potassium-transporting ATPase subunit alpha-4 [Gracilariopsis chorda]|uniref:Sodium/potassium-transporting ATPase subunit alpha-4 n=1 Tax=Gracilariopsis chorda TaxID=448386 RepID=A0A2V3J1T3_9FLOR|nr:Sodium/potassium-transporting ATPase subunit alpha-4 [Gracilariopsis chorda]|eukprot:PXF48354.1 Sodium/potassium-transporting ATPase subunit alpha-4 [Gracilariopsis chorda]